MLHPPQSIARKQKSIAAEYVTCVHGTDERITEAEDDITDQQGTISDTDQKSDGRISCFGKAVRGTCAKQDQGQGKAKQCENRCKHFPERSAEYKDPFVIKQRQDRLSPDIGTV